MENLNTTITETTVWFTQGDAIFWLCFIGMWVACLLLQTLGHKWLGKEWMQKLTGDDCHCSK